jgi:hypothetical protein
MVSQTRVKRACHPVKTTAMVVEEEEDDYEDERSTPITNLKSQI